MEAEDNLLFEYLKSLSPVKTKKSVTTQMLNSHGMDYSLLASPDATIYEDYIVHTKHLNYILNTSKPEVSSEDVNKIYTHEEAFADSAHACHYSLESSSQHTKTTELQRDMHYNPCSSEHLTLISTEEANWALELLGKQVPNGANVQDDSVKDSVEGGLYIREVGQVEANIEGAYCDYNNLTSIAQSVNLLPQSTTNSNYKMQTVASTSKHDIEDNPFEVPIAASDRNHIRTNHANAALTNSNPITRGVDEPACIKRGTVRPYLCYQPEMTGLRRNNSVYTSKISSGTTKSDEMKDIHEKPLLSSINTSDSQMCVLPRNGLYLNAHPALNNYKGIENEKMSYGRKPELQSCTSSLHLYAMQGHHLSPVLAPMERYLEPSKSTEDFTKSSVHVRGEDFGRSTPDMMSRVKFNDLTNKLLDENMKRTSKVQSKDSIGLVSSGSEHEMEPKRKRKVKWPDLTGEGRACRNCKCIKSRCLKGYCECFAAGVYCIGNCSCKDCLNNGDNEDIVLQARKKNYPKVEDCNENRASKLQKRGCNCNMSCCQNKYCACFKDGVGCSPSCNCQGCINIHGRKDSTAETKSALEETEASQISRCRN